MKHATPFKKVFFVFKYVILGNKNTKCTIHRKALDFFVRTIWPDIIAFFEIEEGNCQYKEWIKEKRFKNNKIIQIIK